MRVLIAGLAALLFAGPAMADPIPADVLERDRKACIASNPRYSGIEQRCTCYIVALARSMTFQAYTTAEAEVKSMRARGVSDGQIVESIPDIRNALRSCR